MIMMTKKSMEMRKKNINNPHNYNLKMIEEFK